MRNLKILNKLHWVHALKIIHAKKNQNSLIIEFTETNPRRGNSCLSRDPNFPKKSDQRQVQESKQRWSKSLIQYISTISCPD